MAVAKNKKYKPATAQHVKFVNDIYNRFQAKAAEITAKNLATFESAFKKIDYLEINHILHQLSQIKGLR